MGQSGLWSVDRLAASRLIAELELEETDELTERIAQRFSEHRRSLMEWTAERVQANMVRVMEASSGSAFAYHSEQWALGFCQAEELIATTRPGDFLNIEPEQPRSKGQILRSMIRTARHNPL